MFSTISWPEYLLAVVVISLAYYLVLALTSYRTELSQRFNRKAQAPKQPVSPIPIVNGVMGSVLFDEDEQAPAAGGGYAPQPTTQQSTASEYFTPDEEDLDAAYDEDDSESEAEQARQWDIMEELVERLSTIVETRPKNISADALIAELRNELRTVDKNVYEKFQESISAHLTELIYAHLSIDLSGAELRRLWA